MNGEQLWIKNVINNNTVCAVNERGQERILFGRGIGFKQKPGQSVDLTAVVKEFVPKNKAIGTQRYSLLADMPQVYLEIAEGILKKHQELVHSELDEGVFLNLVDHISFAVARLKKGIGFQNTLLSEIKAFYPQEYETAQYGLQLIKEKTGFQLPPEEAGAIAMHLVNGELQYGDLNQAAKTLELIQKITAIVRSYSDAALNEEDMHYVRFVTHLKFFAQRLFKDEMLDSNDRFLHDMVKSQYSEEYRCAERIASMIWQEYTIAIPEEEMMYLTVYIRRITKPED